VERAGTRERIERTIVRDPQVPGLGVQQTMHRPPAAHDPGADPRADREVTEAVRTASGAPAQLAERCGSDIRLQRDRHAEPIAQRGTDHRSRPPRLGRRGEYLTPARRALVEFERTERADPDRPGTRAPRSVEEREDARNRRLRLFGRETLGGDQVVRTAPERTDAPAAAGLDAADQVRRVARERRVGPAQRIAPAAVTINSTQGLTSRVVASIVRW
jgi:hypothetical protein